MAKTGSKGTTTRKVSTKRKPQSKKSLAKALELLAAQGIDLSHNDTLKEKVEVEEAQREHPKHFRNLAKNREMEAEGALFFLKMTPKHALTRSCRREKCDNKFLTNYLSISYCSNECRRLDLQENFAIKWNEQLAEEQWGIYEPGLTLSGPVVNVMIKLLERLGYTVTKPETPEQNHPETTNPQSEPAVLEADSPKNEVPEQAPSETTSVPQSELDLLEDDLSFLDDLVP